MLAVRLQDSHINGNYLYLTASKHKVLPPSEAFLIKLPDKWVPLFLSLWTAEREGHCALLLPDGILLEDGNISFFTAAFQRFFRCHNSVLEPYDARRLAASCYHALGV